MAIDLDAARAARREADQKGPEVILDGVTYELPVELPFAVLEAVRGLDAEDPTAQAAAIGDLARALLGKHYAAIGPELSLEDLNDLIGGIFQEYGIASPLEPAAS